MEDKSGPTSPTKAAIITASATVLAAVIALAGTLIVAGRRNLDVARDDATKWRAEAASQLEENTRLQTKLNTYEHELERVKNNPASVLSKNLLGGDATVMPSGQQADTGDPEVELLKDSEDGINVSFRGCRRTGTTVRCYFVLMNQKEQREVSFHGNTSNTPSRAFDKTGQEHRPANAKMADIESFAPEEPLPSKVPVRASLTFRDIQASLREFSLLQVGFRCHFHRDVKVDFHDVRIEG